MAFFLDLGSRNLAFFGSLLRGFGAGRGRTPPPMLPWPLGLHARPWPMAFQESASSFSFPILNQHNKLPDNKNWPFSPSDYVCLNRTG
jgi:hypothetical protein